MYYDDFIADLCSHCTEGITHKQDAKSCEHFFQLERQFIECMGYDFVMEYQSAADAWHAREFEAAFLSGLRFAAQFMLSVFPVQSSPSAP